MIGAMIATSGWNATEPGLTGTYNGVGNIAAKSIAIGTGWTRTGNGAAIITPITIIIDSISAFTFTHTEKPNLLI
jgi:hypothetical protein